MKAIRFNTEEVRAILDGRKTQTRRLIKPKYRDDEYGFQVVTNKVTGERWVEKYNEDEGPFGSARYVLPQYKVGNILYVQETWRVVDYQFIDDMWSASIQFKDMEIGERVRWKNGDDTIYERTGWRPSIHMPKEAARLFLRVTGVRVERLRDITDGDAIAEGIQRGFDHLSDADYQNWARRVRRKEAKKDWGWNNYLWHGDYGEYGTGNKLSDAWEYQESMYDSPILSYSSLWNSRIKLSDWDEYGWDANPWVWVYEVEMCEKTEGIR